MTSSDRRRLIPAWTVIAAVGVLVAVVVTVVLVVTRQRAELVSVPSVVGVEVPVARSRLGEVGLLLRKGDQRFSSTVPADGVLEQDPVPGARVPRGSAVVVVVSGGSGSFALPDVTGQPLSVARAQLQDKGLVVQTDVAASDRPKNVVISSLPGPGVIVSTSDIVKLTVSSGGKGVDSVKPADLTGRTFVIDPAPVGNVATDTPMEVERRLQSLLVASGAKVVVTRSITDTQTPPALRALRAAEGSTTAVIGLDVLQTGSPGIVIVSLGSTGLTAPVYLGSQQLVQALSREFGKAGGARSSEIPTDTVLNAVAVPGVRVVLGSRSQAGDIASFADPSWADSIARVIYTAIVSVDSPK
jgi:N-acetylmuramoyl-L-alanine amidase